MEKVFKEFYPDSESRKEKSVILEPLQQKAFDELELVLTEKTLDIFGDLLFPLFLLLFAFLPFFVKIEYEFIIEWVKSYIDRFFALIMGLLLGVGTIIKIINSKKRTILKISEYGVKFTDFFSKRNEEINNDFIETGVIKLFRKGEELRAYLLILKKNQELVAFEITNLKTKEQTIFTKREWSILWSGRFSDHQRIRNLLWKIEVNA